MKPLTTTGTDVFLSVVLICASASLLMPPGARAMASSLLVNGDFEDGGATPCSLPTGWRKGPGGCDDSCYDGLANNCIYIG